MLLHVVGAQEVDSSEYCCARGRTRYILYGTYYAKTNNNSSGSATAASLVCCCLRYTIHGSIDSVQLLPDINCIPGTVVVVVWCWCVL